MQYSTSRIQPLTINAIGRALATLLRSVEAMIISPFIKMATHHIQLVQLSLYSAIKTGNGMDALSGCFYIPLWRRRYNLNKWSRDLPDARHIPNKLSIPPYEMTVERCLDAGEAASYNVCGLQYGQECCKYCIFLRQYFYSDTKTFQGVATLPFHLENQWMNPSVALCHAMIMLEKFAGGHS